MKDYELTLRISIDDYESIETVINDLMYDVRNYAPAVSYEEIGEKKEMSEQPQVNKVMYTNTGCEVQAEETVNGLKVTTPVGAIVHLNELEFEAGDGALHLVGKIDADTTVRLYWHREDCPNLVVEH